MENFFPVEVKEEAEKCEVIECDRDVTCLCCGGHMGSIRNTSILQKKKLAPADRQQGRGNLSPTELDHPKSLGKGFFPEVPAQSPAWLTP